MSRNPYERTGDTWTLGSTVAVANQLPEPKQEEIETLEAAIRKLCIARQKIDDALVALTARLAALRI
jgi:hypothetical protein